MIQSHLIVTPAIFCHWVSLHTKHDEWDVAEAEVSREVEGDTLAFNVIFKDFL